MSVFNKAYLLAFILGTSVLFSGCSMKGHEYTPDFNSINKLKEQDVKLMTVRYMPSFSADVESISMRGSTLESPYHNSYSKYLEVALTEHLKSAFLYDKNSKIVISGQLLKNDFTDSSTTLSASFVVNKEGKEVYKQIYSITHQWDSNFVGAIAFPRAMENYVIAVQKLINSLMIDPNFLKHVKK